MAICHCCQKDKPDVKSWVRDPRSGQDGPPLCGACWTDPALAYKDCKHGEDARARD